MIAKIIDRKQLFNVKSLLSCLYVSAANLTYVKKAKILDGLKSRQEFPDEYFVGGKYMILLGTRFVCMNDNDLLWKSFQDVHNFTENNVQPQRILLDITTSPDTQEISCLFALDYDLCESENIKEKEDKINGVFINTRDALLKLNNSELQYVAQATGLSHFNKSFRYCPLCGGQLIADQIGAHKRCKQCNQIHYPHVSPIGIVLVEHSKHDRVLLVRQGRHPRNMLSCVAGFIESGESLYQAIQREVAEEVGLNVTKIEFLTSQPWAMPSSQLMLACIASVDEDQFDIDKKEIEKAFWVNADDLKQALQRSNHMPQMPTSVDSSRSMTVDRGLNFEDDDTLLKMFWVPPPFTASRILIDSWLSKYHSTQKDA